MEKAYDRLEWEFIYKCLHELGFHPKWIAWVNECMSSVSYSLLISGEPNGFIKPTRGIRQGDPLTPYIFLLCMEVLTQRILTETNGPKSGVGVKISPRDMKIPCLLFANDCLLFAKANLASCSKVKSILDLFCSTSGQLINYYKSILTFSQNATLHQKQVTSMLNIPQRESLGKYLRCPVFQGCPSKSTFQELISKATAKLEGWKANCLSKAGRSVLIQSHLEALPTLNAVL